MENSEIKRVRVALNRESETSYGCLVDLIFDENGRYSSGSRLEWFPKKICTIETEISKESPIFNVYYLNCPKWLLDKKGVKYEGNKKEV